MDALKDKAILLALNIKNSLHTINILPIGS